MKICRKFPCSPHSIHRGTTPCNTAFCRAIVTQRINRFTSCGWRSTSHWAIIPPWDTPSTVAPEIPSVSIARARSSAKSTVVLPSRSTRFRLKQYTRKRRPNSRYCSAKVAAMPRTVRRPSPRPGSITSSSVPWPKAM